PGTDVPVGGCPLESTRSFLARRRFAENRIPEHALPSREHRRSDTGADPAGLPDQKILVAAGP
ncbi:MAG: hypothetical protein ACC628_27400, partial [Pirellulaceae bacterium]